MGRHDKMPSNSNPSQESFEDMKFRLQENYSDTAYESAQEQEPLAKNPTEQNVENAKTRLETLEGRGAEIRGKVTEKMKDFGRRSVSFMDRSIGRVASGAEKMKGKLSDAREYAGDLKDAATERVSQRQARKEQRRTAKERAISDQFNTAKADEAEALSGVRTGDAETFNYMEPGTKTEQAGRQQAKQEAVDAAHEEALAMKEQEDQAATERAEERERIAQEEKEERERAEKELQESDASYTKAESYLKSKYKGRNGKDLDLNAVKNELRFAFPSREQYILDAIEDAFNVFAGKKTKQAARAARIAKGKAKVAEVRHKSYEATRDRSSEAYQKALSSGKKLGRSIARFSRRAATTTKVAIGAARDAWKASKETLAVDTEPVTNE